MLQFNYIFNFVVWILCIKNVIGFYQTQPKILSEDGELIIESAVNKNITFRLTGTACLLVNDINLLDLVKRARVPDGANPIEPSSDIVEDVNNLKRLVIGSNGLADRIRRVENGTTGSTSLRMNRLQRRVRLLSNRVSILERKLRENNCSTMPCRNGGTCIDLFDDYFCQCPDNWEGKSCDADVDECARFAGTDLGCQNNAACINLPGTYQCQCTSGWFGLHCTRREVDCKSGSPAELCGHGACVPENSMVGYKCICEQGWKTNGVTPSCSVDVDECAESKHNCMSGCINLPGSFICAPCSNGYTGNGVRCTDVDECENNNGGCSLSPRVECINTQGSYRCGNCPAGWSGDGRTCIRDQTTDCASARVCHPLAHCQLISNMYVCTCPVGMTGSGYGQAGCTPTTLDPCSPNRCLNGGSCVRNNSSYTCVCTTSFEGQNCERSKQCHINPCQNGGTCVTQVQLPGFKCMCRAGFAGSLCDRNRFLCGTVVRQSSGTIRFPPFGNYASNERCAFLIKTDEDKILNIVFTKFDVQVSEECRKDFLQIHDGRSAASQLIGRFCGPTLPKGGAFNSTHNQVYFWFRSDDSVEREGFSFSWNSSNPICGGKINITSHGTIQSPGYPGKAPPNRDCVWELLAPPSKVIQLAFFEIELPNRTDCDRDYLEILDDPEVRRELKKFCSTVLPQPLQSLTNAIFVNFHTDNQNFDSAFKIHYSLVDGIPQCGGTFAGGSGVFESPILGDMSSPETICNYLIRGPDNATMELKFEKFHLSFYTDCQAHSVEIFDGKDEDSPLFGRWCSDEAPENLTSTSNYLFIKYKFTAPPLNNYYGFKGTFRIACGGTFTSPMGIITSPLYPQKYLPDRTCIYKIDAPAGNVITIKMEDFALASFYGECYEDSDYVKYYSPELQERYKEGQYCALAPETFVSKYNTFVLEFISNPSAIRAKERGFKASYSFEAIGCGGVYKDTNGTISYTTDQFVQVGYKFCEWILFAPIGHQIYLEFQLFNLNDAPNNCSSQKFSIYTNETDPGKLVGHYCGSPPMTATYASTIISLQFEFSQITRGHGFRANYRFIDGSQACGGRYITPTGVIQSPGWPHEYNRGSNCVWIIRAAQNQQIELNVKQFILEGGIDCYYDSLEIRNGDNANSPLIGKYCGETIPKKIPSTSNKLYLHFKTDNSVEEQGFLIEWEAVSTHCGGTLRTHKGSIISPHYPTLITEIAQCDWTIVVNAGSKMSINFTTVPDSADCTVDYLSFYDGPDPTSRQLSPSCDNFRTIKSTSNAVFIRYLTTSGGGSGAFMLDYKIDCKNELRDLFGVIESPNYPDPYPIRLNCQWTIKAPKGNKISVAFSHIDLEMSDDICVYDYLEISHIRNGEVVNRTEICTMDRLPSIITSVGEAIMVSFTSDESRAGTGFRLEYQIEGCGRYFTSKAGRFESPNSPYSVDVHCEWVIEADYGNVVELTVIEFHMETSTDCNENGLLISNDKNGNNTLLQMCHTEDTSHVVTSTGRMLYIKFYTDNIRYQKYVKASFRVIPSVCGGNFRATKGEIYSPYYPQAYSQSNCEWLVSTEQHHTLDLQFKFFDLENSVDCMKDYVEIYNGPKKNPYNLLLKHCGPYLPTENLLQTTESKALVVFKSDNSTAKNSGFALTFSKNCGKEFVDESTGFFIKGVNDHNCIWTIRSTNESSHISLHFTNVQCNCEEAPVDQCESIKGVAVLEGAHKHSSFCQHHPPSIVSNGQILTVEGKTGSFEAYFSLYENSCGGTLKSLKGKFASPRYPNSYPTNIECVWEISSTEGSFIELTFETMDILNSEHCSEDYLEVRERNSSGKVLGIYCSSDIPTVLTIFEKAWIKFRSDNDFVGRGFIASWNYAHNNYINGTAGKIRSPSIESIRNDPVDFNWQVEVTRGNVIFLAFKEYNQGLKIFDGFDETAQEVELQPSPYQVISSTNIIYIQAKNQMLHKFLIEWSEIPRSSSNETTNDYCPKGIIEVPSQQSKNISSPGYPVNYPDDLDCEWILKPNASGNHVFLRLYEANLEDISDCSVDYLLISSSEDLVEWKLEKKLCTGEYSLTPIEQFHGRPYLKINFHTDISISKSGFTGLATTVCGGTLTDTEGTINGAQMQNALLYSINTCVWQIRVRPGRKIQLKFVRMNIPNRNSDRRCQNGYVSIRDGYDEHSAYLGGIGRYCSGTEIDLPETLSHRALIKAAFLSAQDLDWMISYHEISEECGYTVQLTNDDNETTISTPNYPNTPKPYTECTWLVIAPIGESLYLSFEGIFDLSPSAFCQKENVEIRDGSTSISRLVGKYCYKRKPYQSTGNGLYLKYTSNTPEPRIGFEAKIKIAKCGGSYDASSYEVKSEKYPALGAYPSNSTCEYRISVWRYYRLNLTLTDIHLPYVQNSSENDHLKLYITPESEFDKDLIEIASIYGNNTLKFLEVETNKILIKFFTFKPNSQYRGFRIRFTRIPGRCGRDIIAESGRLTMPVHSDRRYFLFCQWTITVPKGRRVKLEITKVEEDPQAMGTHTIAVYNDPIRTMPITFINNRNARFVQSTDNFMLIKIYRGHDRKLLALDMNFTSEEQSLCPPDFGDSGTFTTTAYTGTYYCKSSFKLNSRQTMVFYLTLQQQRLRMLQDYEFPLVIKGAPSITLSYGSENIDNKIVPISASEGTLEIRQYSPDINITRYNIGYRKFECGGIEILESTLIFTKPNMTNVTGSYDCAWQLRPRYQRKFNLTATYKLNFNCSQEYLEIYAGLEPIESFKKVCGNDSFQFIIHTEGSYLHYHSITDNPSSSFEIHIKPASNCGGTITENYGNLQDIEFSSTDYQNNLECVWDISPKKGMSTEINFYGRFYIQESNDCSKDYLEIRQLVGDEWTSLPRICGRHLPDSINITNTKIQIIFRSDESKTGDGFNIKFRSICGGIFEVTGDKQYLEYPLGIEYHTFNFVCNYTLVTSTSELIQINFLTFDLDTNGRCPSGRMKVFKEDYYEISMEQAGTYCTSNSVKSFKTRHQIYLIFEASLYRQIPIYKFEYYLDICGGPITNSTVIQTPKDESGDSYPPSMNCLWNITAPEDQAIVIQFKSFDMHNYFECSYDYVYIYSGKEMKSENQINRLCGNLTGVYPVIKITGNRALLLAKSDESSAGSGFTAAIKFVKKCDEKINLTETNPSYPFNRFAYQYEHELDCHYQFNAPNGYFVMAEFHNFNISRCEHKPECVCDYLEARDGDEATSQIIATYCGNTVPTTVLSTSESLLLRFVSDGQGSATGFAATVRIVKSDCGSSEIALKWDEGTDIASPNFGVSSYPPNTICKWVIASNNTIELNFEKIDLEEADAVSGTCLDYVDIMLLDQVDNEHDVLCGNQTPHSYYLGIGTTIVQILFKTNGEVERAGFKLTARQTHQCNVTYAALSGRIQKRAETNCGVHIIVPENYTLSFHFRNFYLTSENCTKQYLKFIDERTGQLIRTLCESSFESLNVFTNTNQVKIDVVVDIAAYFDITYVASNEGTGCGGNLDSTTGQISSPFYPENVRNYTQCRWNIHGAKNKRIQFSFLDFDMGSNINCDSDYVQFLEISGAGQERVTRKFCGQDKPGPYVSNSNEVSIVYKKTVNFDGSGWVLRYLSITS